MATTISQLVSRIRFALTDAGTTGGERFPLPLLFSLITDGLKDIAAKKPNQVMERSRMILVAGVVQSLPAAGATFLYATRNYGLSTASGVTPGTTLGPAILPASLSVMDNIDPNWFSATSSATIIHAMADPVDQSKFYVYPAPTIAVESPTIEVAYVPVITVITAMGDVLPFVEMFDNALTQYVCHRAMQADSEADGNSAMSVGFYNQYIAALEVSGASVESTLGKKLGKGV